MTFFFFIQWRCLIEAGLQPQSAIPIRIKRNNRVTKDKYCTTPVWKPAGFVFKAVWVASFRHSERKKKATERRAAGSVWERRDYLYSTSPHYGSIKVDTVLLCVQGWLQPDCGPGWLKSKQRTHDPPQFLWSRATLGHSLCRASVYSRTCEMKVCDNSWRDIPKAGCYGWITWRLQKMSFSFFFF